MVLIFATYLSYTLSQWQAKLNIFLQIDLVQPSVELVFVLFYKDLYRVHVVVSSIF